MTAQEARTHIRYSGWASRKVLEAALALSPEDRAKSMNVSHESVAKTLTHIYSADADIARQVHFKSRFVGDAGLPAWQIVMHVVNHGTLHRGQIVGMLRQLGVKPPATDIVFYYYEQKTAAT